MKRLFQQGGGGDESKGRNDEYRMDTLNIHPDQDAKEDERSQRVKHKRGNHML